MPPPVGNRRAGPPPRSRTRRSLNCLFVSGVLFAVLAASFGVLDSIKDRWYIFDHVELHKLAQSAVATHGNNTRGIIDEIVGSLRQSHPASALSTREEWVFNNAGGAMGAMYIIHASITECVDPEHGSGLSAAHLLAARRVLTHAGTPLGTEGHSGRHTADDYFNILSGEQWAFAPGALEMEALCTI